MPSSTSSYRIIDEPVASSVEKWATNPLWPFFASMFGGVWLAWPWFVFNAFALGSSKRWGDVLLVLFGVFTNVVLLLGAYALLGQGVIDEKGFRYAELVPQGVRLFVLYALFMRQSTTFELYTHFGGVGKNGIFVVLVGYFLRERVLEAAGPFGKLLV
jgi:hypothetical protein